MTSFIQNETKISNGLDKTNSTTIQQILVERGLRPIETAPVDSNGSVITKISKQHQDQQQELQELNTKLSNYLGHVHDLETFNGQLLAEIDQLRQKWGVNTEQLNKTQAPELRTLRDTIDGGLRDQILRELQLKQYEYDIEQSQLRIHAFENNTSDRLNTIQGELKKSNDELERLKNLLDRHTSELGQQRIYFENLGNEFDGLQIELLNHRLERIMVGNELQTLREHAAFQKANYQAQQEEILSLNVPAVDLTKFYGDELLHAISDIRKDFQILSQTRLKQWEEYYRIKTEEVNQKFAEDNQRKSLIMTDGIDETDLNSIFSSLTDIHDEWKELKETNNQLEIDYNDTVDDLKRSREEQIRDYDKLELEYQQLQQELQTRQKNVDEVVENNVSLEFEVSTYRNLIKSEEKRIQRNQQEAQSSKTLPIPKSPDVMKGFSVQKVEVKKSTLGPVSFDSIDFVNDGVIITYDKPTGDDLSLGNWTVHHQNDQQPELVYQFPSSVTLKPRETIRILAKRSPQSARKENGVLLADQIETWGQGQVMTTRLIDRNNQEKAKITQTRLPSQEKTLF